MNTSSTERRIPFSINDDRHRLYLFILYGLYAAALLLTNGFTAVVGVIAAYILRNEMRGSPYFDHLQFLIKTFWVALIGCLIALPLLLVLIGWPLLAAVMVWYLYRLIAGVMKLVNHQPIDPDGWLA